MFGKSFRDFGSILGSPAGLRKFEENLTNRFGIVIVHMDELPARSISPRPCSATIAWGSLLCSFGAGDGYTQTTHSPAPVQAAHQSS